MGTSIHSLYAVTFLFVEANLLKIRLKSLFNSLFYTSISGFIIAYTLFSILAVIILGNLVIAVTQNTIEKKISESELNVLSESGDKLNLVFNELRGVMDSIYTNRDIQKVLEQSEDRLTLERNINSFFIKIRTSYSWMINEIYIFSLDGYSLTYSTRSAPPGYINLDMLKEEEFYENIMQRDGKIHLINGENTSIPSVKDKFMMVRFLPNTSYSQAAGILVVTFNKNSLLNPYKSLLNGNSSLYIGDDNGKLIAGPDKDLKYTEAVSQKGNEEKGFFFDTIEKEDSIILFHRVKETNLYLIRILKTENLFSFKKIIVFLLLVFIALVAIISVIFYLYVFLRIYRPIDRIINSMRIVESGNFVVADLDIERADEIGMLNRGFVTMVKNLDGLFLRIKEEQEQKRKAEIQMLQAQINPHFLYNTLSTIRCMVDMDRRHDAHSMIISLVKLLKNTLRFYDRFITIEEELNTLKAYLYIQLKRYNSFAVDYEIEPEAMKCRIPRLILQPILENSIKHGFQYMEDGGKINISIRIEDNIVIVKISDNGCGISKKRLQEINSNLNQRSEQSIGINNVHQRIRLLYGDRFGIKVDSPPGGGVVTALSFPYEEGV